MIRTTDPKAQYRRCLVAYRATPICGLASAFVLFGCLGVAPGSTRTAREATVQDATVRSPDDGCSQGGRCVACAVGHYDRCQIQCDQGDGNACDLLGMDYDLGVVHMVDHKRARILYERGCSLGSLDACQGVAGGYVSGVAIPKDVAFGSRMFIDLCARGHAPSCTSASRLLVRVGNASEAFKYAERGCGLGNRFGCRFLSEQCAKLGSPQPDCAKRALERACALGDSEACP